MLKLQKNMKNIFIVLFILLSFNITAQDNIVSFIVGGTGANKEIATKNALKSALKQTYEMFVSSDSNLFNDTLLTESLVDQKNGYFVKVDKLSMLNIPNGEGNFVILKPIIAVDKLLTLAQSKKVAIEQKGGLFSYNINQQTLNEKNELDIVSTLYEIVKYFYKNSFNYKLSITNPKVNNEDKTLWDIGLLIKLFPKKEVVDLVNFIYSSYSDIALPMSELENYSSIGKDVYPVSISLNKDHFNYILMRNKETRVKIDEIIELLIMSATDFNLNLGFDEINLAQEEKDNIYFPIKNKLTGGNQEHNTYTYEITESGEKVDASYIGTHAEPFFEKNQYFKENFPFVLKLSNRFIGSIKKTRYWKNPTYIDINLFEANPGLIVSLDQFNVDSLFTQINFVDTRTLNEMNKIKGYNIITPDIVAANYSLRGELIKGAWQNIADTSDVKWFDDKKMASLYFDGKNWSIKSDENNILDESEYYIGEECKNSFTIQIEDENENKNETENNFNPKYLSSINESKCWQIINLNKELLKLKNTDDGGVLIKYRRVPYKPISKTINTISK